MDREFEAHRLLSKLVPDERLFQAYLKGQGKLHEIVHKSVTKLSEDAKKSVQEYDKALSHLERKQGVEAAKLLLRTEREEKQTLYDIIPSQRGRRQTAEEYERIQAADRIYALLKRRKLNPLGYHGALLLWYFGYIPSPPEGTSRNRDSAVNQFWTLKDKAAREIEGESFRV